MINQPMLDQDDDVLMLNPDPETADLYDDDDDDFDGGADFDELGSGATSGYGEEDLADLDTEDEFGDDDLSEELDDDIEDDLDDDSME